MKKLPLSISDFKRIITENRIYVDKTRWIYKLVNDGGFYFMSRPRRFGKTLTISTLNYLFKGEKELFKDTYIYDKWDFKGYNVLRIDMTKINPSPQYLEKDLKDYLIHLAKYYGVSLDSNLSPSRMFDHLIQKLSQQKPLVVLIDEYDAPLLSNLLNERIQEIRELMAQFYVQIKNNQDRIMFAFITGITKFTKVSVFSKLNNLIDITLNDDFNEFLGYTDNEIKNNFKDYIKNTTKKLGITKEALLKQLKNDYNGYSWNGKTKVYCPYSIVNFFYYKEFRNFWYETGSPSYLINWIKRKGLEELNNLSIDIDLLSANEIEKSSLPVFLWQAGYLTIVNKTQSMITFDFPNKEVKESFSKFLVADFTDFVSFSTKLKDAFIKNDWKQFIKILNDVIGSMSYYLLKKFDKEQYWQILLYLIFKSTFHEVQSEIATSKGRSDLTIIHNNKCILIEIKLNKPPVEGLKQIKEKEYYLQCKSRQIVAMALTIDPKKRKIVDFAVENI